jgi:2-C-methyl-D-erythritol 2,4-cyclodiphosphate synthase
MPSPTHCSARAGLGDIGRHFPDTDAQFRGADSAVLLAEAARRVREAGWEIGNVDSTVVAQAPKLAPHIEAMRQRIARRWAGARRKST